MQILDIWHCSVFDSTNVHAEYSVKLQKDAIEKPHKVCLKVIYCRDTRDVVQIQIFQCIVNAPYGRERNGLNIAAAKLLRQCKDLSLSTAKN